MQTRTTIRLLVVALALLAGPVTARAQLLFILDNPDQAALPGQTVQFLATLQNTDPTNALTLDGSDPTIFGPGTLIDKFLSVAPETLAPGEIFQGNLFDVQVSAAATPDQSVSGSYAILYTLTGGTQMAVAQNYSVAVTPAPPGLVSAGIGVLVGAAIQLRRRRRKL